ncbi:protease-4 [Desulfobaculum xiamenense]|uniref:Protease-4 n=1 Tax=Desulfobaculum xiamenense TaxID=995050 RepID=A0A846QS73_9BACT|nr:signal peptide peptidase SppA [Desulfobaculum xiamenense]NJB68285.1 protease-4 [Desulfobaculum xiamenense]
MQKGSSFSQKHPFIFGLTLIVAAVILFAGVTAAFRIGFSDDGFSSDTRLGLVRIEGMITDSEETTDWIRTLREDESIRGVLLRINSPGGAVAPSQEIARAVERLAQAKPVVVSMSTVAASGGYYAAAPADLIVANPSTLTGSIGVIMELSNLQELMDKIGVKRQSLTSGALKGAGSPFRPMTQKEREYLMGIVNDMHEQFVEAVAKGREMDIDAVRAIADGRALTGRQALELGLVDTLGGMEEAIEELKKLCEITEKVPLVEAPEKKSGWLRDILTSSININITSEGLNPGLVIH